MDDRRQDTGRTDRPNQSTMGDYDRYGDAGQYGNQGRYDQSGQSGQAGDGGQGRSMTATTQGSQTPQPGGDPSDWQGYVVPYRYYGPGYRGVGYYAVMYQGPGEGRDQGGTNEQQGWATGRSHQGHWGQAEEGGWAQDRRWGQTGQGRGGFAGKGPKGYQRSDERIREDINDRLTQDDRLDAQDIEVQVRDGEVTLTGTVPDRQMKRLAEDLAESCSGVREVMNQLRVQSQDEQGSRSATGTGIGSTGSTQTAEPTRSDAPNGQRRTAATGTR